MKKTSYYLIALFMALFTPLTFTSCGDDEEELIESDQPGDRPGDNDKGDKDGNEDGQDNQPAVDPEEAYSPWNAYKTVGNEAWYRSEYHASRVDYGGRKTSESFSVFQWVVDSVDGNTATIKRYLDLNYDSSGDPIIISRNSAGARFLNGRQITKTQSPAFYLMNLSSSTNATIKETYSTSSHEYINNYVTRHNGYTTSVYRSLTETWGYYGLRSSSYSDSDPDATIGSSSRSLTMVNMKFADTGERYGTGFEDIPEPEVTGISAVGNTDGTATITLNFNHKATAAFVWGYEVCVVTNDGYLCRARAIKDCEKMFGWSYKEELDPSKTQSKSITMTLTAEGLAECMEMGKVSFGVCALGYGKVAFSSNIYTVNFNPDTRKRMKGERVKFPITNGPKVKSTFKIKKNYIGRP